MRNIIQQCFEKKSLSGLLHLLGFDAAGVRVDGFDCDVVHHGTRGTLACYVIADSPAIAVTARSLRTRNFAELQLYAFVDAAFREIVIGSFGFGEKLLTLTLRHDRIHAADLEALEEMLPVNGEEGSLLAARHARALDRGRVTKRFFADFAAQRDLIAKAWLGPAPQQTRDREQLALLLLSRLMFLYFLQHRGYLTGDRGYLLRHFRSWKSAARSFYRGVLHPLFFFVLNRKPEQRRAAAAAFGDLPYLNGGLFERHPLERKHARLDLPNEALASVFDDLLERYRFTSAEASDAEVEGVHDLGVDPEMLGRVFEGLMAARVRETTGTFYTPAATVDRLVCDTVGAYLETRPRTMRVLKDVRVLDPACGSGAFLLGALSRIAEKRAELESNDVMSVRRDVVARSLYGVDLQGDAALLCALRLWLALVPGRELQSVQPLPNLDRHIRQGDSLIDPLDLRVGSSNAEIRRAVAALGPAASAYTHSDPTERPALQRVLAKAERKLAHSWVAAQQTRMTYRAAELKANAQDRDLFGEPTREARLARAEYSQQRQHATELKQLARRIASRGEVPFFSFAVHFPDAALSGFDIVLCNPPWVRTHNWPRSITAIVKRRFAVCAEGHQVDLALLFLERSLELLSPGGTLGIILPAKFMRSLSGSAARRLLLEKTDIVSIEDHSLDQRSIFNADAFAALIVARKRAEVPMQQAAIRITSVRRGTEPLRYALPQRDLPFEVQDAASSWLLVPPDVGRAISRMRAGPRLDELAGLKIRRGIVSGSNAVMVLTSVEPKISGLAVIRAEGYSSAARPADFEAVVEADAAAPLVRGSDLHAWRVGVERHLLVRPRKTEYPRLARYLRRHGKTLADVPRFEPTSCAVAWHDLASTLEAAVIPRDIVALNTVYFIPADEDTAHLLCAYFNSLPVRTFARAIAERAKDAHFRFFACTMALLSLPASWRTFEAPRLRELSRLAHERGGIGELQHELDAIVARAFELSRADSRALTGYDRWLRGS